MTKHFCDICGKELLQTEILQITTNMYIDEKHSDIIKITLDLCEPCYFKYSQSICKYKADLVDFMRRNSTIAGTRI